METGNGMEPMQSTDQKPPRSFFSSLGGVYSSPRETFQDVGRSPKVLMPLIALVIMGMISTYFLSMKVDLDQLRSEAVDRMIEQQVSRGNMSPEQAEQTRERMANQPRIPAAVSAVLAGSVLAGMALIIAAVAKLISTTFLGAENTFKSLFSVTLYVSLSVGIIHTVLFLTILYFKDPSDITLTNVNSLVASDLGSLITGILGEDTLPRFLARFLGWVDAFAIWKIALFSIGYSTVSRKLKTATAATWITSIYVVIALIVAAISPLFGQ